MPSDQTIERPPASGLFVFGRKPRWRRVAVAQGCKTVRQCSVIRTKNSPPHAF